MSTWFIAVPLPASVRQSLGQIRPPKQPGVKLVHPDKLHVTLHYLGQITPAEIAQVKTALAKIEAPCCSVDLLGVGTFPEQGVPRVLWAGVAENPRLDDFHRQVGTALTAAIGFVPESRPFQPHVTLARLQQPVTRELLAEYRAQHEDFKIVDVPVDRIVLFESAFAEGKSVYRERATRELNRPG